LIKDFKEKIMWIARDKNGYLYGYSKKPTRRFSYGAGSYLDPKFHYIDLPKSWFPDIKFEDGPKRIQYFDELVDYGCMSLKK